MKVLCIVFSPATGSFGSLTRVLALAREFSRRGHEVRFCASGNAGKLIEGKNFPLERMPVPTLFGLPLVISHFIEKKAPGMRIPVRDGKVVGNVWFLYALTGMLDRRFLSRLVAAQTGVINSWKPDLLVTEMDPGAYISARITNVPIVTTFAKIAETGTGSHFWRKARSVINSILRAYGKEPVERPDDLIRGADGSRILGIIPSVPTLDGSRESVNTLYVGNILEPVRDVRLTFSAAPGKRYVFVYSGTGSVPLERLMAVLPEAFSAYPEIECLVAASSLQKEEKIGNVFFAPWIPAREILPQCDLVICHGGLNTITQSLEYGVPIVAFPGPIFERRYNAEMLMKAGAGMMGESADFNPEWIRSQFERRGEFTRGVHALKSEFAHYSGTESAVNRIIDWINSLKA
jgi:hypothetical protein